VSKARVARPAPAPSPATSAWLRQGPGEVSLEVLVQPRASRQKIGPVHDGRLKLAVTSPPVDGEANAAVVELLSATLAVSRSSVEVIAGASSRRKTIRIRGLSAAAVQEKLSP
jgi:uncharacterized protein